MSENQFRPYQFIVPIFAARDDLYIVDFLGAGTFIGNPPLLVTTAHILQGWQGTYVILVRSLRDHQVMRANELHRDPDVDLTLLQVPEYLLERGLELAEDSEIRQNQLVACYEYSHTRLDRENRELNLHPAVRLGNVTEVLDLHENPNLGKAGKDALLLSFPTLQGACGAPVVSNENYHVWGIINANVDRELLPIHTITFTDEENGSTERINYMMPQGIAIHVRHLRRMLQNIQNR